MTMPKTRGIRGKIHERVAKPVQEKAKLVQALGQVSTCPRGFFYMSLLDWGDRRKIKTEADVDALTFLRAVYSNEAVPLSVRMRAAEAALPFERPKLAAVISTSLPGEEFGDQLEAARKRMVEGQPATSPKALQPSTDLTGPPMVSDRRFRRI
jgi:hypothetical protein